jgi:hypothetical protein
VTKQGNDMINKLTGWRQLSNVGLGKRRLPNLLNRLGVLLGSNKFFTLKLHALFFVDAAIFLNPLQESFRSNRLSVILSIMDLVNYDPNFLVDLQIRIPFRLYVSLFIRSLVFFNPFQKMSTRNDIILSLIRHFDPNISAHSKISFQHNALLPVLGVEEWCQQQHKTLEYFYSNREVILTKPQFINEEIRQGEDLYEGMVKLPDTYLAEFKDVIVIYGTDLVFDDKNKQVIYDEIACTKPAYYDIKSHLISSCIEKQVKLKYNNPVMSIHVTEAIHFIKDYSKNYFHWLIECLPRLMIVNNFPHIRNLPLIIDADMPSQHLESLELINENQHPIIMLPANHFCRVEKLYFPSSLSIIHNNHYSPVEYDQDMIYSPEAINFVREFFRKKIIGNSKIVSRRKIYICRKSTYRHLRNADQVEMLMREFDFEIVHPETLTFRNQVKLFVEARIVVGQGGAGLANLLFVPSGCEVIVLINNDKVNNFNMFHGLASILGLNLKYLLGRSIPKDDYPGIHNDFSIDVNLLREAIS